MELFREKLLQQILTKDTTILGIQKFGAETDFSNIEVYQSPIDFEFNQGSVVVASGNGGGGKNGQG